MSNRYETVWRNKYLYEISKVIDTLDSLSNGKLRGDLVLQDFSSVISEVEQNYLANVARALESNFF